MPAAAEIRVQDEQGNIHVFPGEATPAMIAQAMHVKPPDATQSIPFGQGMTAKQDLPSMPGGPASQPPMQTMGSIAVPPAGRLPGAEPQMVTPGQALGGLAGGAAAGALPFLGQGAIAAAPAVQKVAQGGISLAKAHPFLTYLALQAAQSAPGVVGKVASKIPSWLPLLAGGKAALAAPEAAEAEAAAPAAEAAETAATKSALPKQLQPSGPPKQGQEPLPDVPQAKPAQPSQWPPPEPTGAFDKPVKAPGGLSDTLDDQAVRGEVQSRIDQSDRKWQAEQGRRDWAANTVGQNKGDLVQQAGGTVPQKPVKYTKTPGVSTEPISKPGETPAIDDQTPILNRMLEMAKTGKKLPEMGKGKK